jgi:hypothetical protein
MHAQRSDTKRQIETTLMRSASSLRSEALNNKDWATPTTLPPAIFNAPNTRVLYPFQILNRPQPRKTGQTLEHLTKPAPLFQAYTHSIVFTTISPLSRNYLQLHRSAQPKKFQTEWLQAPNARVFASTDVPCQDRWFTQNSTRAEKIPSAVKLSQQQTHTIEAIHQLQRSALISYSRKKQSTGVSPAKSETQPPKRMHGSTRPLEAQEVSETERGVRYGECGLRKREPGLLAEESGVAMAMREEWRWRWERREGGEEESGADRVAVQLPTRQWASCHLSWLRDAQRWTSLL